MHFVWIVWHLDFLEAFELLFELDSTWQLKVIPDKNLRKSMRGDNMTLQKDVRKNIAKKYELKFEFIWSLQKMFF